MAVASREVESPDAAASLERMVRSTRVSTRFRLPIALALFAYVLWFRTHDITQSFGLAGDQVRDWQMALRSFSELPLTGVSSTAGGTTIGPAYYWILWGIARVIGPFTGYLPHAGGIGISALQSLADALLFLALSARLQSWPAALLIVLAVATSGYDATLSSTIWNPPVAVAFVKMALAAFLWERTPTWRTTLAAIAASWLAVHCHTTGILVAVPVIGWLAAEPLVARDVRSAGLRAAAALAIVGVLQIPWLVQELRYPAGESSEIATSLAAFVASPLETLRLRASAALVADSMEFILLAPAVVPYFGFLLVAANIMLLVVARDARLIVSAIGPVITGLALFAVWQGRLDQIYWFLVLAPSAAIGLVSWIPRMHPRAPLLLVLLLAALAVAQPARAGMAWTFHRTPGYGAVVEGCREITRQGRAVRDVRLEFGGPAGAAPLWVCSLVGVDVDANAPMAVIDSGGGVRFEEPRSSRSHSTIGGSDGFGEPAQGS